MTSIVPLPHQQKLLDAPEREILLTGWRGSGMTVGSALWLEYGERSLWIVRDHHARQFHIDLLMREDARPVEGTTDVATPDDFDNLRGLRFDRIAFDIPADDLSRHFYLRVMAYQPQARFLVATAPSLLSGPHWIMDRFKQSGAWIITARSEDNPHLWNGRWRDAILSIPTDQRASLMNGEWPK